MTLEMTTALGDVLVTVQNDRTAYVRAGTNDREETLAPLTVRGVDIRVRGHWTRGDDGAWFVKRGNLHTRRADGSYRDTTPAMDRAIADAVAVALTEHIDAETLHAAGRAKAEEAAHEREVLAAQLDTQAKALRAEAKALRKGGRVVYLVVRMSSGAQERVRTVEMPNGRRLAPVREVTVYGAARYAHGEEELQAAREE